MLYLECASGVAGDMVVGALLDLGADQQKLAAALKSLPVDGYHVRVSRVRKSSLAACDFDVQLDAAHDGHDHDMAYLHGDAAADMDHPHGGGEGHHHGRPHDDGDDHAHDHAHDRAHDHDHHHGHGDHDHAHRGLVEIERIIDAGDLTPRANELAKRIFHIVAEAEAQAHGTTIERVHFHEVGAVDSIVDIVAAAVCLDDLDITEGVVSPLAEGTGSVRCQHGLLPIPVPAVANIIAAQGLTLERIGLKGEFVTPTGAAMAAAIRTRDELPQRYRIVKTGIGAGKRTYERPSILRAMIVEEIRPKGTVPSGLLGPENVTARHLDMTPPFIWKLETEVDDTSGEALGYCLEQLFDAGALEAHYVPVFMKKNRPGYQIEVLCREADIPKLEQVIFRETTTIGIRRLPMERTPLPREFGEVETPYGPVRTKTVTLPDGTCRSYPEYDSIAALCRATGAAYQDVYNAAYVSAQSE